MYKKNAEKSLHDDIRSISKYHPDSPLVALKSNKNLKLHFETTSSSWLLSSTSIAVATLGRCAIN